MRALWLKNQELRFRDDLPLPSPSPGEALIRVLLAGICNTDLEMVRGYSPFRGIPGHEFIGEVVESPDPNLAGARVVGEINITCGACRTCRAGHPSHCENRTTLGIHDRNGTFAEYLVLPIQNLHRVPDTVPDEAAVLTEPLAAALEIQQQIQVHPGDRVLVVGAGRLGMLIAQTLALTGCDLHVVIRHAYQQELLSGWGIATLQEDQITARDYDIVVEVTGSPGGFSLARQAVRPRGILVLKSTYAGNLEVNMSALVVNEITLVGSRCGPFEPALRLLESMQVDPRPLIMGRYPLTEGLAALKKAAQPGVFKILLEMEE